MVLQASRYFRLFESRYGEPAVGINTLTGGSYAFDSVACASVRRLLESPNVEQVGELFAFLVRERVLVDANLDELAVLKARYRGARASTGELYVTYALTDACNFRCAYCYQEHRPTSLSKEAFDKTYRYIERELPKHDRLKVHWFGGEPLLQIKTIEAASRMLVDLATTAGKGFFASVTTNGSLLSDAVAARLKAASVTQLELTIDGAPADHDKLRTLANGKGTYVRVAAAIERSVRFGFTTLVRINLSPRNVAGIRAVLQDFERRGLGPDNIFLYLNEMKHHANSSPDLALYFTSIERYGESLVSCLKVLHKFGYPTPRLAPVDINCAFDKPSTVLFGVDGNLYHCTTGTDRALADLEPDGTVSNETERRRWVHSREPWDDPTCKECMYLPTCMGGCAYLDEAGLVKCNPDGLVVEDLLRLAVDPASSP